MKRIVPTSALGLSIFAIASAFAADGYVTGDVNLRAGPDPSYPSVVMLGSGIPVVIEGCIDGWSWCDVATRDNRGWVAGDFLQEEYRGRRVLVPAYGVQIGIPIVSFVFGTYWESHYRDRPWYGERERWSHVSPQYRPAVVRDRTSENPNGNSYGHSQRFSAGDTRSSNAPRRGRDESSSSGMASTRPASAPERPSARNSPRAAATNDRSPERYAGHVVPVRRNAESRAVVPGAVADRVATNARPIAQHNVARSQAPRKEMPAKPATKQEDGKNKDQR